MCVGKCALCERSGIVYPVCACKQVHAACYHKGECSICGEEFYLPSFFDLLCVAVVLFVAIGSVVVRHL